MADSEATTDDRKALAEKVIAWASVAYALGFAVVLLHTARLGVPVLELVKPIYILIGLPLALLVFFSRQILKWFQGEAAARREELAIALKEQYITKSDEQNVVVEKIIIALQRVLPWYIPARSFRGVLGWLLRDSVPKQNRATSRPLFPMQLLDRSSRSLYAVRALVDMGNLGLLVAVGGFLVFQYVWVIYPRLPMAYGGGASIPVRLSVKVSEIPPDIHRSLGARKIDGEEASLTERLDLLYITSTAYLVRLQTGSIVSLDKEVVTGVLYPGHPGGGRQTSWSWRSTPRMGMALSKTVERGRA